MPSVSEHHNSNLGKKWRDISPKMLHKMSSVGTPPPPKPWETTTLSSNNGSSSTTKDTPLASGDAIKPWDVPGAGERPSGACDDRHHHHHRFVFVRKNAHQNVSRNVFDFFQLRALSSLSLPFASRRARARLPTLCSSRSDASCSFDNKKQHQHQQRTWGRNRTHPGKREHLGVDR